MKVVTMNQELQVGIAEFKIARSPCHLVTLGLGSCVGVSVYDPMAKIGGLIHIMLPDSTLFHNSKIKPAKFADLGIPLLLKELQRNGGQILHFQAKLAGGSQMFSYSGNDGKFFLDIGQRNIFMVRTVLKNFGVKIIGEDVGGSLGRTMILDTCSGRVLIKTVGKEVKVI